MKLSSAISTATLLVSCKFFPAGRYGNGRGQRAHFRILRNDDGIFTSEELERSWDTPFLCYPENVRLLQAV